MLMCHRRPCLKPSTIFSHLSITTSNILSQSHSNKPKLVSNGTHKHTCTQSQSTHRHAQHTCIQAIMYCECKNHLSCRSGLGDGRVRSGGGGEVEHMQLDFSSVRKGFRCGVCEHRHMIIFIQIVCSLFQGEAHTALRILIPENFQSKQESAQFLIVAVAAICSYNNTLIITSRKTQGILIKVCHYVTTVTQ